MCWTTGPRVPSDAGPSGRGEDRAAGGTDLPMQAWINVGTVGNFEVLRKRGFDLSPFKSSRQKQSSEMRPGDRIVYYLSRRLLGHYRIV